jgi:hypothetical protein
MNGNKTASMLRRVPMILAVTANSYGLPLQALGPRKPHAGAHRKRKAGHMAPAADGKTALPR